MDSITRNSSISFKASRITCQLWSVEELYQVTNILCKHEWLPPPKYVALIISVLDLPTRSTAKLYQLVRISESFDHLWSSFIVGSPLSMVDITNKVIKYAKVDLVHECIQFCNWCNFAQLVHSCFQISSQVFPHNFRAICQLQVELHSFKYKLHDICTIRVHVYHIDIQNSLSRLFAFTYSFSESSPYFSAASHSVCQFRFVPTVHSSHLFNTSSSAFLLASL